MRILIWAGVALAAIGFVMQVKAAPTLKVGDPAPDFSLQGSDGKTYKLSDFRGKQAVVLAWFPKAFTPGCTAECKSFKEKGDEIRKYDVAYFTISVDNAETNARFAKSLNADYPILADPDKEVARAYGVVNATRPVAFRWTFYIDKEGKIAAIDENVQTGRHGSDVAAKLETLGVAHKK